jgi:hypothetical protein
MSDTLPIDLNSADLGIADPFNGHIDDFPHLPRPAFRRLDRRKEAARLYPRIMARD